MSIGAGAGFALEDAYVLTRSILWADEQSLALRDGLELFDKVRGPHYRRLVGSSRRGNIWSLC
jgi:salicylate hydroxylase